MLQISLIYARIDVTKLYQPKNCSREVFSDNGGQCNEEDSARIRRNCRTIRQLASVAINAPLADLGVTNTNSSYNYFACYSDYMFTEDQTTGLINEIQNDVLGEELFPEEPEVPEEHETPAEQSPPKRATRHQRFKRKVKVFHPEELYRKWPNNTIPYIIDGTIGKVFGGTVKEAIKEWEDRTCLSFPHLPHDTDYKGNHLLFITTRMAGCYSYIGMALERIPQPIYLSASCFSFHIYISHEVGHALGMYHEHQRQDREDYVTIHPRNIKFQMEGNFAKIPRRYIDNRGIPYDLASAMHYREGAFSIDNQKATLTTNDPNMQKVIGQRVELSFFDVKAINDMYCADKCVNQPDLRRPCLHHGYRDPLRCSQCRCPDGWSGRYCERVAEHKGDAECGGELQATLDRQTVMSPFYGIGPYTEGDSCSWLITAPEGSRINFRFLGSFSVFSQYNRCQHWVEVRHGHDLGLTGPRFCGNSRPAVELSSNGTQMLVIFKATSAWTRPYNKMGFKFEYLMLSPMGCLSNPCDNDGQCSEVGQEGEIVCLCRKGFSGRFCEEQKSDKFDLVFLIDNSNQHRKQFRYIESSVVELFQELDYGLIATHVGAIQYSTSSKRILNIGGTMWMSNAINELQVSMYQSESSVSNLMSALWELQHSMLQSPDVRFCTPKIALILTDGILSHLNQEMALSAARDAKNAGIKLIVVAIGEEVNLAFYHEIAGSLDHVIEVKHYDQLDDSSTMRRILTVVKSVFLQINKELEVSEECINGPTTTTTTPATTKPTTKKTTTVATTKPTTMSTTMSTTVPTTVSTTTRKQSSPKRRTTSRVKVTEKPETTLTPTQTTTQATTSTTTEPTTASTTTLNDPANRHKTPALTTETQPPTTSALPTTETTTRAHKTTSITTTQSATSSIILSTLKGPVIRKNCKWEGTPCSRTCGGCGTRRYIRYCEDQYGNKIKYQQFEVPCNIQVCSNCYGRACSEVCCEGYYPRGRYCQLPTTY